MVTSVSMVNLLAFMFTTSDTRGRDTIRISAASACFKWLSLIHCSRALERQISTLYYERLLASQDKAAVAAKASTLLAPLSQTPREFVRDLVLLEFLGLPGTGRLLESDLEQGLMDKLQAFLLELGKGFAFCGAEAAHQHREQGFLCRPGVLQPFNTSCCLSDFC